MHTLKQQKKINKIDSINFFIISFFFLITQKLLYETKKRRRKHNKLLYLGKNKLDCIEILISQAITNRIIDDDEFKAIINEKKDYDSQ